MTYTTKNPAFKCQNTFSHVISLYVNTMMFERLMDRYTVLAYMETE